MRAAHRLLLPRRMAVPSDTSGQPGAWPREWNEFLSELRVILPGVQLLFAFLLTVPFTNAFAALSSSTRGVYVSCFFCTTAACAFLAAPTVYHRLHWRRDVRDKEEMLRTCNRMAILGGALLALAMIGAAYVLSQLTMGGVAALAFSTVTAALFGWLWFGLPLSRRFRDRRRA